MNIVILADHGTVRGGAPQVAIASALALADLGQQVTFVQGVGKGDEYALGERANLRHVALGGTDIWSENRLLAAKNGIWNTRYISRVKALLAQFDPVDTVVHVHQWTKFFSPSIFAVVQSAGLPLAVTLHDYFLSCPNGLRYRFDIHTPCNLVPLSAPCIVAPCDQRSNLHKAIRVLRTLATRRTLRDHSLSVIHVSEVGRANIGPYLPSGARQFVLDNPIAITPTPHQRRSPGGKAVYCGRLTREKGADLVAKAARSVGMPSVFIGDGPERSRILEIDPSSTITGWVDSASVAELLMTEARVLVAPSRWPETGPLVVAEALAGGIPVIVSNRAGASHGVVDGETGFVVRPTATAISNALATLTDTTRAERMGAAARARYWANPPLARTHALKLMEIYRQTLPCAAGR